MMLSIQGANRFIREEEERMVSGLSTDTLRRMLAFLNRKAINQPNMRSNRAAIVREIERRKSEGSK